MIDDRTRRTEEEEEEEKTSTYSNQAFPSHTLHLISSVRATALSVRVLVYLRGRVKTSEGMILSGGLGWWSYKKGKKKEIDWLCSFKQVRV